jgi:HEPN domain-containing protein
VKTKEEHITHWINQSNDDWESTELLFTGKKYLHALFFAHLSLEKVCKAHWINSNESSIPPKTHNLIFLLSQTTIELTDDQKEFLLELTAFKSKAATQSKFQNYIKLLLPRSRDTN